MPHPPCRLATALVAVLLLGGCSTVCDRDRLPGHGDASTPEKLCAIVQHACRHECWGTLYDFASERTRSEYSYVKFRVGFPDLKPPGHEETVAQLVARTTSVLVAHSHLGEEFRLAYLTYLRDGEEKDLNVLLVEEKGEDGRPEWHVAVQEQVDRKVAFD